MPKMGKETPSGIDPASPDDKSFHLAVELQTTDTQETKAAKALLDSGATGLFMEKEYTTRECICKGNTLSRPRTSIPRLGIRSDLRTSIVTRLGITMVFLLYHHGHSTYSI